MKLLLMHDTVISQLPVVINQSVQKILPIPTSAQPGEGGA